MQKLLMPALLAFGVGFTGIVSASATTSTGITIMAATNASPSVRLAAHRCKARCDENRKHCHPVCR